MKFEELVPLFEQRDAMADVLLPKVAKDKKALRYLHGGRSTPLARVEKALRIYGRADKTELVALWDAVCKVCWQIVLGTDHRGYHADKTHRLTGVPIDIAATWVDEAVFASTLTYNLDYRSNWLYYWARRYSAERRRKLDSWNRTVLDEELVQELMPVTMPSGDERIILGEIFHAAGKNSSPWAEKAVALRAEDSTYGEIGQEVGVSRERVRQVLNSVLREQRLNEQQIGQLLGPAW